MKVITSIYLNCRPDLRDEWLTGTEVDDVSDAQVWDIMRTCHHLIDKLHITGSRTGSSPSCEILYDSIFSDVII